METKHATFTFFTLLFLFMFLYTVSAARHTVCPPVTIPTAARPTDHASKLPKPSGRSKIFLPGETTLHPGLEKPTNELNRHTNFSKFHPINRHFHARTHRAQEQTTTHRRPCLKHKQHHIPFPQTKSKDSVRNNEVSAEKSTDTSTSKRFPGEVPGNWLKAKHHYGARRQHNNNNQNHDDGANMKEEAINVTKTKNVLGLDKMNSLNRQLKQKKNEDHKAGVMKNIRKFLKHTFD